MSTRGLLFVHDALVVRGGGERILLHAAGLARKRGRVDLALVWNRPRACSESELSVFDSVIDLDCQDWLRLSTWRAHRQAMGRLREALHTRAAVACVAFSFGAAFRTALAARYLGLPMAWVCQEDVQALSGVRGVSTRRLAFAVIRRARPYVVCLSQSAMASVQRLGFDAGRLRLIRPSVDVGRFESSWMQADDRHAWRRQHGIPDGDLVVVCVAHLNPVKNHRLLIDAVRIARDAGLRVTLVCVGGVVPGLEEHAARLVDYARAVGVQDQVRWVGPQDDVRPWLAMADSAALASEHEASPLALAEAGACGLPLLATDVTGIREMVIPEATGVLFAPRDAQNCAGGFARLADDAGLRDRLGRGALTHMRTHFDSARADERWEQLFDELLAQGPER